MADIVYNKNGIPFDIDNIATDLNGKADVDLTNLSDTGKIANAHNAMPSNTFIDIIVGASGTKYTAPADGWYCVDTHTTGRWVALVNDTNHMRVVMNDGYIGVDCSGIIPVKKGDVIALGYDGTWSPQSWQFHPFIFVYAEDTKGEA